METIMQSRACRHMTPKKCVAYKKTLAMGKAHRNIGNPGTLGGTFSGGLEKGIRLKSVCLTSDKNTDLLLLGGKQVFGV